MNTKHQQGSAHLIIIIALVVVVLGALGFVFWQNFINKPVNSEVSKTSITGSAANGGETSAKKLVVSEWGIDGNYESVGELQYNLRTSFGETYLEFTSPEVAAAGEDCDVYSAATVRYSADDVTYIGSGSTGNPESTGKGIYETMDVPNSSWVAKAHIGDKYYFMSNPQSGCDNAAQESATEKVRAAAVEFLLDAKTIE
jgi:hypothetical protein